MIGKVQLVRSGGYDPEAEEKVRDPSLEALDAITDAVLAYKPKPKSVAAKKRTRKAKRDATVARKIY